MSLARTHIRHPALPPLESDKEAVNMGGSSKSPRVVLPSPRRTKERMGRKGHQAQDSFDLPMARCLPTKTVTASLPTPSKTSDATMREKRIERTREFTTELMNAEVRRGLLDFGLELNGENESSSQESKQVLEACPPPTKDKSKAKAKVDDCPWRTATPIRDEESNPFLATGSLPATKTSLRQIQPGTVAYVFRGRKVVYEDPQAFLAAPANATMADGSLQFQPKRLFQDEIKRQAETESQDSSKKPRL